MTKKIPYRFARNVLLYVALVWLVGTALSVYHHQPHAEYVKQEVRMQSWALVGDPGKGWRPRHAAAKFANPSGTAGHFGMMSAVPPKAPIDAHWKWAISSLRMRDEAKNCLRMPWWKWKCTGARQ